MDQLSAVSSSRLCFNRLGQLALLYQVRVLLSYLLLRHDSV